ncbi:QRFP-like peptide receptor [Mercenaria mercenaria]|uniref:QRFP-like peptide receptor n=1 Tax=Mercenaria mercenaria TaxID=6596 RepID=UPI001E1D2E2B|nr:QRFP-like peptide receptor [Mercenaria mercenaria]
MEINYTLEDQSENVSDGKYVFNTGSICEKATAYHQDYTQLTPVTIAVVICYIFVVVLAVLGNLLVIWTVWRNCSMHTVTNYYIVNLAISDLLVASIVMPLKLLEYTADCEWHIFKSDGLCSVVYYLLPIFVFASVLTLAAISIERYYAIVHPLSAMKINSKSRTRKIIACTWIIPIIVASPFVYCRSMAFTIFSEYGQISREICNDRFDEIDLAIYGNDPNKLGEFRKGYFLFLFFVIYVIPSVVILTTCVKIAISLLQPITVENSVFGRKDNNRRQEENKRKVARMVVVIAITFIISWSPQYLVSVISQLQEKSFLRERNFIFTMLVTHFCGFLNSCLNPIIYTAMSQKFRRSFLDILRHICFCFSCPALAPNTLNYVATRRYTSTVRQTFSEIDGNHIPLNESICHSDMICGARGSGNKSSSSSGTDSDIRQNPMCGKNTVKKYIFKNPVSNGRINKENDPEREYVLRTGPSPILKLKGILKNSGNGCNSRDIEVEDSNE